MSEEITIPFGFKLVQGQLQKGDGVWNGTRFAKVKKVYPFAGTLDIIAIRKCEVEQLAMPATEPPAPGWDSDKPSDAWEF